MLDGCPELTEDTAFEHAFLHAEIDALAAATAELEHSSIDRRSGLARNAAGALHGLSPFECVRRLLRSRLDRLHRDRRHWPCAAGRRCLRHAVRRCCLRHAARGC